MSPAATTCRGQVPRSSGQRVAATVGPPRSWFNRVVTGPDVDARDVRPVSRWSLGWRVLASVALVLLLLNGSLRMSDDAWPFGPMSQYAFSPPADDTVVVTRAFGRLPDGQRVELALRVETSGISRAEIEAQIPAIERDPSLLRAVTDGWASRHPTQPRPVEVTIVQDETHLHRGRPVSSDQVTLTTWTVTS